MPLAWVSTISTRISTAAWKRPGTPEVALRAASHSRKQPSTPSATEKNIESKLKTEKSTSDLRLGVLQVGQVVNDVFAGGGRVRC